MWGRETGAAGTWCVFRHTWKDLQLNWTAAFVTFSLQEQRSRSLERCAASSMPTYFQAYMNNLPYSPATALRRTYPAPLFSPRHLPWLTSWACISQQKAVVGPAACPPLHTDTHSLTLPPPFLLFDRPINSGVFNSFGHHNPSSSKAFLSFFFSLARGKKQQVVIKIIIHFSEPFLVTSLVMITSCFYSFDYCVCVFYIFSSSDRNVFERLALSSSTAGFLLSYDWTAKRSCILDCDSSISTQWVTCGFSLFSILPLTCSEFSCTPRVVRPTTIFHHSYLVAFHHFVATCPRRVFVLIKPG